MASKIDEGIRPSEVKWINHRLDLSESIDFINKLKKKAIFMSVRFDAPIGITDHTVPVMANIKVSKNTAIKYLNDAYAFYVKEDTGVLIKIAETDVCIFLC